MTASSKRLVLDFRCAGQALHKKRLRTQQFRAEAERQNHQLDRLCSPGPRESNSRLLAKDALHEARSRLPSTAAAADLTQWDWQLPSNLAFLGARWSGMLQRILGFPAGYC